MNHDLYYWLNVVGKLCIGSIINFMWAISVLIKFLLGWINQVQLSYFIETLQTCISLQKESWTEFLKAPSVNLALKRSIYFYQVSLCFNSRVTENFPFSYFAFSLLAFSQMIKDIKNRKYFHKTRSNSLEFGLEFNLYKRKQVVVKSVRILAQKGKMAFKTPIVPRELSKITTVRLSHGRNSYLLYIGVSHWVQQKYFLV